MNACNVQNQDLSTQWARDGSAVNEVIISRLANLGLHLRSIAMDMKRKLKNASSSVVESAVFGAAAVDGGWACRGQSRARFHPMQGEKGNCHDNEGSVGTAGPTKDHDEEIYTFLD